MDVISLYIFDEMIMKQELLVDCALSILNIPSIDILRVVDSKRFSIAKVIKLQFYELYENE